MSRHRLRTAALLTVLCALSGSSLRPDCYVTPASRHRWSSPSGIRFNDAGGIRFNDAGGIRFNDAGGIRFNDAGGYLVSDASGIRFNDAGGIRFNDAGGIRFNDAGGGPSIDLALLDLTVDLPDTSSIGVVVTYHEKPTAADLAALQSIGIHGGTLFRNLPMVMVDATRDQMVAIARNPAVRSIWSNRLLSWVTHESLGYIGVRQAEADPGMRAAPGVPYSGDGVTIAFVDTGIDATHPDLPFGDKVIENVRVHAAAGNPLMFVEPAYTEGLDNTDLVLGHGTFGAGIAAGNGTASGGLYRGVAPGARLVGVSVGDLYIIHVLEGFDWILSHAPRLGIRVVNCSFSTTGPFDPEDPVNIATRLLFDAGQTVVFAAGNYGPAPDTLNPYAVAPWVIGVASGSKSGRLSDFSSRGIYGEGLYHPTLTAPGEAIVSTSSLSLQGVFGVTGVEDSHDGYGVPLAHRWAYSAASGTSFAAPHVAGVAALMLQADPTLTPGAIKTLLQRTATPMVRRDRSEVGAGYLDAWAALSATLDPDRPYGEFIAGLFDERPFRIAYGPETPIEGIVPAGGEALVPIDPGPSALAVQVGISWGPFPSASDLDLSLRDATGREVESSRSIQAAGLFGLTEGATHYRPAGGPLTAAVSFKTPSPVDQPFIGQYQTAFPVFDRYDDVARLAAGDRTAATIALTSFSMTGRTSCFCGDLKLTRGEAARIMAMAGGLPQTLPASPTFNDVSLSDPFYGFIETAVSAVSRRGAVMTPGSSRLFGASQETTRLDFAIASVKSLGLQAEAEAAAGATLGLADELSIPPAARGYVAVSLGRGILKARSTLQGPVFMPAEAVTRIEAAHAVAAMIALP